MFTWLSSISISAKLVTICALFVSLSGASLLYLFLALDRASLEIAAQALLIERQSKLSDDQVIWVAEQNSYLSEQSTRLDRQVQHLVEQRELVSEQRNSLSDQSDAIGQQWVAVDISKRFDEMRYWLTDYALSGREASGASASDLRILIDERYDLLTRMEISDEEAIAAARADFEEYHSTMQHAIAVFKDGDAKKAVGVLNASRAPGERVKELLNAVLNSADGAVVTAGTRAGKAAERLEEKAREIDEAGHEIQALGGLVVGAGAMVKLASTEAKLTSEPGNGSDFSFVASFAASEEAPVYDPGAEMIAGLPAVLLSCGGGYGQVLEQQLQALKIRTHLAEDIPSLRALSAETASPIVFITECDADEAGLFALVEYLHALKSRPTVIYMHSLGRRERIEVPAGTVLVTKPVRQRHLLECLAAIESSSAAVGPTRSIAEMEVSSSPTTRGPARVLVVDDNRINQQVACAMLGKLGIEFLTADNGPQCLERVQVEHFDVVLLDCQMPGMNGYETLARIRAIERGRTLPVVAVTASTGAEDIERCREVGMDGYLAKPISLVGLGRVLPPWIPESSSAPVDANAA